MKNKDLEQKTSATLPLQGRVEFAKKVGAESQKQSFLNANAVEDLIGTRAERRECAVGVRVTREMKVVLEEISARTRLSESEIVFRILQKNLESVNAI